MVTIKAASATGQVKNGKPASSTQKGSSPNEVINQANQEPKGLKERKGATDWLRLLIPLSPAPSRPSRPQTAENSFPSIK